MLPVWTDNIHQFDGTFRAELQKLPWKSLPSKEEIKIYLTENTGKYSWTPLSQAFLNLILHSHDIQNQDPSNDVNALDLLYFCFQLLPNYHRELQEQLEEMASGACPQGRCTRLWNVLFIEYGEKKSLPIVHEEDKGLPIVHEEKCLPPVGL